MSRLLLGTSRTLGASAPIARTAAAVIAATGLSLLPAACGGSSGSQVAQIGSNATQSASTPSTRSAHQNDAIAFARCMRSDGVPNWPDPDSGGSFDKAKLTTQQLGAGTSRVEAAQSACDHLLPSGGSGPSLARVRQMSARGLRFAGCVRRHGVPSFPDPGSDGRIPDPASLGIDQGSPRFKAANHVCGKYRPPYIPSNSAYEAYARTHG